jgi:hypothetical protein
MQYPQLNFQIIVLNFQKLGILPYISVKNTEGVFSLS